MLTGLEQYSFERAGYFIRRAVVDEQILRHLLAAGDTDSEILACRLAVVEICRDTIADIGGPRAAEGLVADTEQHCTTEWRRRWTATGASLPAAENAMLARYADAVEARVALTDDESLLLLPGTHVTPLPAADRAVIESDSTAMAPGQVRIRLRAGDALFWNPNVAHRMDEHGRGEVLTIHPVGGVKLP